MTVVLPLNMAGKEISVPKYCCACIPIRIGCFILAYLNLTGNILATILAIGSTIAAGIATNGFTELDNEIFENYNINQFQIMVIGVALIIICLLQFTWLCIVFTCVVGLHKKCPGLIRFYIVFASLRLIVFTLPLIYISIRSWGNCQLLMLIPLSLEYAISVYFIYVYYVHAKELEIEQLYNRRQLRDGDTGYVYPKSMDKQQLII